MARDKSLLLTFTGSSSLSTTTTDSSPAGCFNCRGAGLPSKRQTDAMATEALRTIFATPDVYQRNSVEVAGSIPGGGILTFPY